MNVTLVQASADPMRIVEMAAATCTRKDPYTHLQSRGMDAIKSGHESILEHTSFTFLVQGCSRALLAQLTRHRIASYSVQSQRYVNIKEMPVVIPDSILDRPQVLKQFSHLMEEIREFYQYALGEGVPKEDARYATPQAATTNIMFTMNTREILHFLSLRECNRAQWEIRELAQAVRDICYKIMPEVFRDAGASCRRGKCPEEHPCKEGGKR